MMEHFAYDAIRKAVKVEFDKSRFSPKMYPFPKDADGNVVIVSEKDNFLKGRDNMNIIRESAVFIQFDIYARDTTIKADTFSRYTVSREIQDIVDNVCGENYGLKLTTCKPTPNLDRDIYKVTMIYTVTQIDTRCRFF